MRPYFKRYNVIFFKNNYSNAYMNYKTPALGRKPEEVITSNLVAGPFQLIWVRVG